MFKRNQEQYQKCKRMRELYNHPYFKEFESIVDSEILGMINKSNLLSLFTTFSNYYIMVGMKRTLSMIKKMSRKADELDK